MALQVAVYVRLVAAHALAEVFRRHATLVLDVTLEAVFPLVVAAAALALPRFCVVLVLEHDLVFLAAAERDAAAVAASTAAATAATGRIRAARNRSRHQRPGRR